MNFSDKNLYQTLESIDEVHLDQYDFGVVKMNRQGEIKSYNKYESELAGISREEAIGKNFFTQLAPCTNNFLVAAKYLEGPEQRDEIMDYIFTYRIKPTRVKLRLLVEPEQENQYLIVQKIS